MNRVFCAVFVAAGMLQMTGEGPVMLIQTIVLPQVEGRIDHLALDAAGQRLFVAALGNNTVEVLDLEKGIRVRSIPGFPEPQGIALVSHLGLMAVANGQAGDLRLIDTTSFQTVRSIPLSEDADNVRYDAASRLVYVAHGSGAISAVDPSSGKVTGTVPLDGHPESFQLEAMGTRIFVNVPKMKAVAVIDRQAMKVVATWSLEGAEANYPMALDEGHHRLFVGCRQPARVIVFDTATGRQTGIFEIAGDTDDLFYDAARQRLYMSCGEGFLDVFQEATSGGFTRSAHVPTAVGARTSLFVPGQNRLYLAVPRRGSQQSEIRVFGVRS